MDDGTMPLPMALEQGKNLEMLSRFYGNKVVMMLYERIYPNSDGTDADS
jgi:hypothetical protein